jgi:hypothetical protein
LFKVATQGVSLWHFMMQKHWKCQKSPKVAVRALRL